MARTILVILLVVLVNMLVGCHDIDTGESQLITSYAKAAAAVDASKVGEADIIEQMSINRQAYRGYLQALINYYERTGKNMQLEWAKNELKALDAMPQYNYIIEAIVAGPNLRAKTPILIADYMYQEALRIEKKARHLLVYIDKEGLRRALTKYNQLIKLHPSSDKIDDAAYRAAGIFEHFKDYSIALMYYQRAYQWDKNTPHPARYKAALIMDKHLPRRTEALELYKQALKDKNLSDTQRMRAKERIAALTKTDQIE